MNFKTVNIYKIKNRTGETVTDCVAVEQPLLIVVDDNEFATIMRTPGNDKELSVGFLFSEGLINKLDDIRMIKVDGSDAVDSLNTVKVNLCNKVNVSNARCYEVRSSCGVCGKKKIDDLFQEVGVLSSSLKIKIDDLFSMPDIMSSAQDLSKVTRGVHAAAFFTKDADMIACYEDIGRHNALDKLIGHCLLHEIKMDDKALLLSGRTSYEMMTKAARARVPVVASISAPSSMAVEIAQKGNIALAGILRGNNVTIYNKQEDFIR